MKNYVKISIVAAAVVIILILNPWNIKFESSQEAVAYENLLAIMYFENLAEPDDSLRLGEIATSLLITDLAESQYVRVVSSQRLYDLLKQLGHEGEKRIDKTFATQVATKAKAKWMLVGNILQIDPTIIITSQLIDVGSGRVLASQRINGDQGDKIFSLIDKLSRVIKSDLSLPSEALTEPDPQVADVTTSSVDAYRHYLEGMENRFKQYDNEAEKSFRKALEFDSTLAMAYFWLVDYTFGEEQEIFKNKAIRYSENIGRKEKLFISVLNSYCEENWDEYLKICEDVVKEYPDEKIVYWSMAVINRRTLSRPDKAVLYLEKVIELDPLYRLAYNALAYAYDDLGYHEKSIQAINRYIDIAPQEANPYDTRADLYSYHGDIDNAIKSYDKALSIKPDFTAAILKLANMYLFKQNYAKADSL
jgi:tetratricopeptide (TPR) repeat protein